MSLAPKIFSEVAVLATCLAAASSQCMRPSTTEPSQTGGLSTGGKGTGGKPDWEPFPTGGSVATGGAAPAEKCEWRESRVRVNVRRADSDKVVQGQDAREGQFPWAASCQVPWASGLNSHFCTGSLVAPRVVQTAGHCDVQKGDRIVINRLNLNSGKGLERYVEEVRTHPRFVDAGQGWDIALVKLDQPVADVDPVSLPTPGDVFVGLTASIVGWGRTSENGALSAVLQVARVPLVPDEDCRKIYPDMPSTSMCAGFLEGPTDTCSGDSGGGIVVQLGAGWTLAGGTSYGFGCGRTYGVYLDETDPDVLRWANVCIPELE